MKTLDIPSEKELEFALFCVDYVARSLKQNPDAIYKKLKLSGLMQDYIIKNYDVLHTQGKDYIVEDIVGLMREKGLI